MTRVDAGDFLVQLAWLGFLVPGWCLSAAWTGGRSSLPTRYANAVIGAIGIHACIAALASFFHLGFTGYYAAWLTLAAIVLLGRGRFLMHRRVTQIIRLPGIDLLLWIACMVLVVSVYREPRSADTIQFLMQQQDMEADQSLQPSAIGMEALGVNESMPRWRSHLWHLGPSLLANATSLPVEGVLRRWAPIPIAFSVYVVLLTVIRRLAGKRVVLWVALFAVVGPVLLWYRSYNAFNYSFRLTNSFCLDKDLCLFLIIPSTLLLAIRWIKGVPRSWIPLVLLIPAILKFHPMTSVYLLLLVPFVVIGYDSRFRQPLARGLRSTGRGGWKWIVQLVPGKRSFVWGFSCFFLFLAVLGIGDAQTSHEEIRGIVRMDWQEYQTGRPLHYWVGHYANIPGHNLQVDTSEWVEDHLWLRSRVILNCGLLGAMHLAWLIWLLGGRGTDRYAGRCRWWACTIVLLMLWCLWLFSPIFLTSRPHLLQGFERLHWFAYIPALVTVSNAVAIVGLLLRQRIAHAKSFKGRYDTSRMDSVLGRLPPAMLALLMIYSSVCFRMHHESLWTNVRVLNNLLDFELPEQINRDRAHDSQLRMVDLDAARPTYLREDDRVLFLENTGNDQFWLIKQGVYWSEPYAEAFAWETRGDDFLEDRDYFYRLLDRRPVHDLSAWLEKKKVNLLVDRRPGADSYLDLLNLREKLGMRRLSPGIWRYR